MSTSEAEAPLIDTDSLNTALGKLTMSSEESSPNVAISTLNGDPVTESEVTEQAESDGESKPKKKKGKKKRGGKAARARNIARMMENATIGQRVKYWLEQGQGEEFLHTGSKDHIQSELKAWLDQRFQLYLAIQTHRVNFLAHKHAKEERGRTHQRHTTEQNSEEHGKTMAIIKITGELQSAVWFSDLEAKFLCRSLKTKHAVQWEESGLAEDPRDDNSSPVDRAVVGALARLDQPNISEGTLQSLHSIQSFQYMREMKDQNRAYLFELLKKKPQGRR